MSNAVLLPSCLRDVERSIGLQKTLRLVERFQGQVLYLTKNVNQDCELARVLGFDAAVKISELLGGNQVLIPVCRDFKNQSRNQAIRLDRTELTLSKLAEKYGLSFSQVQKICRAKA